MSGEKWGIVYRVVTEDLEDTEVESVQMILERRLRQSTSSVPRIDFIAIIVFRTF